MGEETGFVPAEVFHPSELIQDELAARCWDKFDLAARMGGDPHHNVLMLDIYFIVGPTRRNCRIGDVMAHQLGVALDVSHQFFLNLEAAWLAHPSTQGLVACDSDGSPKGGDACGSVHDSAGRNGIAEPNGATPTDPQVDHDHGSAG